MLSASIIVSSVYVAQLNILIANAIDPSSSLLALNIFDPGDGSNVIRSTGTNSFASSSTDTNSTLAHTRDRSLYILAKEVR